MAINKQKAWELVKLIIVAIASAIVTYFSSGCSVNHKVIQSSYNATTGDSIVIRYEQIGRLKK